MNSMLDFEHCFNQEAANTSRLTTEIIKLAEIQNPAVTDANGDPSLRVMKYGRTTRWTAGVSNEILSDCQRDSGMISKEWCIINLSHANPFSEKGDSGAVVIDYKGRIGGILHGEGCTLSDGREFTYVTPLHWLFSDIEKTTGWSVELSS
jgi:hypothetical protein